MTRGRERRVAVAILSVLTAAIAPDLARAHRGLGIDVDPCVATTGIYLIHFAAYQPEFDPAGEYCQLLPRAAPTLLVFDLVDRELRDLPIRILVVEEEASEAAEPAIVYQRPARSYPRGTVTAEVVFPRAGDFAALVVVGDLADPVRFPVRVGKGPPSLPILAGLMALGALVGYLLFARVRRGAG